MSAFKGVARVCFCYDQKNFNGSQIEKKAVYRIRGTDFLCHLHTTQASPFESFLDREEDTGFLGLRLGPRQLPLLLPLYSQQPVIPQEAPEFINGVNVNYYYYMVSSFFFLILTPFNVTEPHKFPENYVPCKCQGECQIWKKSVLNKPWSAPLPRVRSGTPVILLGICDACLQRRESHSGFAPTSI